jgi:hypothetical protein
VKSNAYKIGLISFTQPAKITTNNYKNKGIPKMALTEEIKTTFLKKITYLKDNSDVKSYKRFKLDLLERIGNRLIAYSNECPDCEKAIVELGQILDNLAESATSSKPSPANEYHLYLKKLISHFVKRHKLVSENYYLGLWMSTGMAIGVALGAAFDDMGLGLILGMCAGLAFGAGLDADAKKKGVVV